MGNKLLTEVIVGGNNMATWLVSYEIEDTWGEYICKAKIVLNSKVWAAHTPTEGDVVTIKRGFTLPTDEFPFEGQVLSVKREGSKVTLECLDRLYETVKAEATHSYDINIDPSAGVISEIFIDLITTYTPLVADGTSVTDSTPVAYPKLQKFIMRHDDVFDGIKRLAEYLNWYIWYDPVTAKVHFHPKGLISYSGGDLHVGTEITNVPKWEFDINDMVNEVTVFGAHALDWRTELFSGDGLEDDFTVSSKPGASEVYIAAVLQTRGVTSASAAYDYTVDEERDIFTFTVPPGVGVNNIEINYETQIPVPVTGRNEVSIATYGGPDLTARSKTYYEKDIVTIADAEERVKEYLYKYSTPWVYTKIKVRNAITFAPGMVVKVIDTINDQSTNLMINKITMKYPYDGDELKVGDKELRLEDWEYDVARKIKDIQNELSKNIDLLIHLVMAGHSMKYKRHTLTIHTRDTSGVAVYDRIGDVYGVARYSVPPGWGAAVYTKVYGAGEGY